MIGDPVIERVAVIGSTNAELIARAGDGEPPREGDWLIADRQTGGRGRLGREWQDGIGNFMGSTVVHLRRDDPPPQTLALVAGIAVFDAVASLLPDPRQLRLKWPNDLLMNGAKLAGILLEKSESIVVVGIGVNLASAPMLPDRRTAALTDAGLGILPTEFATRMASAMADALSVWRSAGLGEIIDRWHQRGPANDTPIRIIGSSDEQLDGAFAGLDNDGALLIRLEDGTTRAIHAGEVALLDDVQDRKE